MPQFPLPAAGGGDPHPSRLLPRPQAAAHTHGPARLQRPVRTRGRRGGTVWSGPVLPRPRPPARSSPPPGACRRRGSVRSGSHGCVMVSPRPGPGGTAPPLSRAGPGQAGRRRGRRAGGQLGGRREAPAGPGPAGRGRGRPGHAERGAWLCCGPCLRIPGRAAPACAPRPRAAPAAREGASARRGQRGAGRGARRGRLGRFCRPGCRQGASARARVRPPRSPFVAVEALTCMRGWEGKAARRAGAVGAAGHLEPCVLKERVPRAARGLGLSRGVHRAQRSYPPESL